MPDHRLSDSSAPSSAAPSTSVAGSLEEVARSQVEDSANLATRAEKLLDAICTKVLEPEGAREAAERVRTVSSAEHQSNSVILVGEVNRGKSHLANALIGVRGATPVGADYTTAIPVMVGPTMEGVPANKAVLFSGDEQEVVSHSELVEKVGRSTQDFTGMVPTRAYVAVENSKMGDVIVVDAPGVGGIRGAGSVVHQDTQFQASVIIVVADASSQLTRPEMEFLAHAAAESASVIVAVTKTDKNVTRYRSIVDQNKALIDEHIGVDIPVLPVSSILPFAGLAESEDKVDELAGLTALREAVSTRFANAATIPIANGLRSASLALEAIDTRLTREIESLEHAETALPDLTAERARLEELRKKSEGWDQFLTRDLTLLRTQLITDLEDDLYGVNRKWKDYINEHGFKLLRNDPQYFTRLIEEDFQRAAVKAVDRCSLKLEKLIEERFEGSAVPEEILEELHQEIVLEDLQTTQLKRATKDIMDPASLMIGISGGSVAGTVLGAALFGGILGGVGMITATLGFRAMKQGKTQLQNWLKEASGVTQRQTTRVMDSVFARARPLIVVSYKKYLTDEIASVDAQISEAEQTSKLEEKERVDKAKELKRRRSKARNAHARAEEFIGFLGEQVA
ncbi:dynamin family protein [Corynebacterium sp. 20_84]